QRIVPQAMTIGATEDPAGKEEPLSIAARGTAIAPHLGRVQGRDGIDQIGQGRPERVFMEVPVGDALDGGIGNVIGEAGLRFRCEITAICGLSYIVADFRQIIWRESLRSLCKHSTRASTVLPDNVAWPFFPFLPWWGRHGSAAMICGRKRPLALNL